MIHNVTDTVNVYTVFFVGIGLIFSMVAAVMWKKHFKAQAKKEAESKPKEEKKKE